MYLTRSVARGSSCACMRVALHACTPMERCGPCGCAYTRLGVCGGAASTPRRMSAYVHARRCRAARAVKAPPRVSRRHARSSAASLHPLQATGPRRLVGLLSLGYLAIWKRTIFSASALVYVGTHRLAAAPRQVPAFIPLFGGCEPLGGGAPGYQIAYGVTVECAGPHGLAPLRRRRTLAAAYSPPDTSCNNGHHGVGAGPARPTL